MGFLSPFKLRIEHAHTPCTTAVAAPPSEHDPVAKAASIALSRPGTHLLRLPTCRPAPSKETPTTTVRRQERIPIAQVMVREMMLAPLLARPSRRCGITPHSPPSPYGAPS